MISFIAPFGIEREREKFIQSVNRRVGKGNWYWCFRANDKLYSHELGMQLYEDAYWVHLRKKIDLLKKAMQHYDVYVIDRHDLEAGLSYKKQVHPYYEHYADIAVRRCLRRYGIWFNGKDLLHLRGSGLDDVEVPFHLPYLINSPDKTAKAWLECNRVIVVAKEIEDKARLSEMLIK
jgi:hypothetical protein